MIGGCRGRRSNGSTREGRGPGWRRQWREVEVQDAMLMNCWNLSTTVGGGVCCSRLWRGVVRCSSLSLSLSLSTPTSPVAHMCPALSVLHCCRDCALCQSRAASPLPQQTLLTWRHKHHKISSI